MHSRAARFTHRVTGHLRPSVDIGRNGAELGSNDEAPLGTTNSNDHAQQRAVAMIMR